MELFISTVILTAPIFLANAQSAEEPLPSPFDPLPPPASCDGGAFFSPDTTKGHIINEGSAINITWRTKYDEVDLYLKGYLGSSKFIGGIAGTSLY